MKGLELKTSKDELGLSFIEGACFTDKLLYSLMELLLNLISLLFMFRILLSFLTPEANSDSFTSDILSL